jgi:predicted phage baseplate assembly protein
MPDEAAPRALAPTAQEVVDALANPPGQPRLRRQVAPHALALARLRDRLGAPGTDVVLRSLARHGPDEAAVALLDAWAVVCDTVSFYSERIADEGYLRTAVQRRSVRELARVLGYELRPGVAAQVDLAFTAETAPGAPSVITVPAGTPLQSVPGPGELPQTFETGADLEARPVWNALAAVDSRPQTVAAGQCHVWVRGPTTVRAGDTLVLSTQPDAGGSAPALATSTPRRDVRVVVGVAADPEGLPGWTQLQLDRPVEPEKADTPAAEQKHLAVVSVHAFRERLRLFGWNAPNPNMLVVDGRDPPGSEEQPADEPAGDEEEAQERKLVWSGYAVCDPLEIDGDRPALLPDGLLVLEQSGKSDVFTIDTVQRDGAAKFALTGPITKVDVDETITEGRFSRQRVLVHAVSVELPAREQPDDAPVAPTSVVVAVSDPPLPPGRRILLSGSDSSGRTVSAATDVRSSRVADDGTVTLTVTGPLPSFRRQGLTVLANVVTATHGETVQQVLGSGDGRARFATFPLRRGPLTHVRATTPAGARAELTVRVDGVEWQEVESLADAGPGDRVYALRHEEDGSALVVLGDGVTGARAASGTENITAQHRVGIGAAGAVAAGAVSIVVRRPLGIRAVQNPLSARDWAPAETLDEARTNAPLRIRTLDRAVSAADHEDVARAFAGVGPARADLLWDGSAQRVLVTVLGSGASQPSGGLAADLHEALDLVRDPGAPLDVHAGELVWCGARLELAHDPAFEREVVLDAVRTALTGHFGPAARTFAVPITAAEVLVVVRAVPGVAACTVPRLFPLASLPPPPIPPALPGDEKGRDVLTALPGRWDGTALPAQLRALANGAADIGEMVL